MPLAFTEIASNGNGTGEWFGATDSHLVPRPSWSDGGSELAIDLGLGVDGKARMLQSFCSLGWSIPAWRVERMWCWQCHTFHWSHGSHWSDWSHWSDCHRLQAWDHRCTWPLWQGCWPWSRDHRRTMALYGALYGARARSPIRGCWSSLDLKPWARTHQLGTKENQLGTKGVLAEHFFEFATQLPPVGPKIGVGYVGYVWWCLRCWDHPAPLEKFYASMNFYVPFAVWQKKAAVKQSWPPAKLCPLSQTWSP